VFTKGLNLGVDFIGGQMIRVTFTQSAEAPVAPLRGEIEALGYGEPIIQRYGKPNEISIRMKLPEGADHDSGLSDKMARTITADIKSKHADARVDGVDSVSGKVSGELWHSAVLSLGLAALAVAAYIWLRFEWQFAVGTVAALIHDVVVTVGVFSILQLEFDLTIVAALLTILGYSINDTVVVFDRLRENLMKYKTMPLKEVMNLSVNETLSRTLATSFTTLLAVGSMLALGGDVIRGFSFAIFMGIILGTYSSVYVAKNLVLFLGLDRTDKPRASGKGADHEFANIDA
jgi:preprotein translocase subunit SecF